MRAVTEEQRRMQALQAQPGGRRGFWRSPALLVGYSPRRGCALLAPWRSPKYAPRTVFHPTVWSVTSACARPQTDSGNPCSAIRHPVRFQPDILGWQGSRWERAGERRLSVQSDLANRREDGGSNPEAGESALRSATHTQGRSPISLNDTPI